MKPRFARILPFGIVVLLALLGFVATWTASSQSACVACHRSYLEAGRTTAHAHTGCLACHGPGVAGRIALGSIVFGRMTPARLLGRVPAGPVSEVSRSACLRCHAAIEESTAAGRTGLRIKHATCAVGVSCDSCHSATAHGKLTRWLREPVMQDCTACHVAEKVSVACDTCHIARTATAERLANGPWQVTHGANWVKTHGMGDLDSCVACHPSDYCVRCHDVPIPHPVTFGAQHGQLALKNRSSCLQCHKSGTFCSSCHRYPMPHPSGFLQTHPRVAKTSENPDCLRCHTKAACNGCHIAHIHPGFLAVPSSPSSEVAR